MHMLFVARKKSRVRGEYAAGDAGLLPPSSDGQTFVTFPRDAPVSLVESTTGRPVATSTRFAQLTSTNGWATSTSPVARSIVYANPFLSKWTRTFRDRPLTTRSARIISEAAS